MTPLVSPAILQLIFWSVGLFQLILGLYVIIINSRNTSNRYTSALFLSMAVNSFAAGTLANAASAAEAIIPTVILASITVPMGFSLAFVAIVLVKPSWMFGPRRWPLWSMYVLWGLPAILTLADLILGTHIWYLGLPPDYAGGYLSLTKYTGLPVFRLFYLAVLPLLSLFPLGYLAFFDERLEGHNKRLAKLFFLGQAGALLLIGLLRPVLPSPLPSTLVNLVVIAIFGHAAFSKMLYEGRAQRGRIQVRLTLLTLAVSVPLLVVVALFISRQASDRIRKDAEIQIEQSVYSVVATTGTWLQLNIHALEQMVLQPGITSMDPAQQKPILEAIETSYPYIYLVSTTDKSGINVARSDDKAPKDYSDRAWVQKALQGEDVVFQTLIGRTSGEPALVVSRPIRAQNGEIIGVGMFASDLNDISDEILSINVGETGQLFVVDAGNRVVAHTTPEYANQLLDFSAHPAVATMRNQDTPSGTVRYTTPEGVKKLAYYQEIEYGWGVVFEQDEQELLAGPNMLRLSAWLLIAAGSVLLGTLTALSIRQTMRPINSLTETANAIAAGDLTRVAPVESEDEFGLLARTFNRMTEQLLDLIGNLEQRVAERTRALENRSEQLMAAAEVGRTAATMLDTEELIQNTVALIRERFDLYYVGLFLLDDAREYAVLKAGTGEAGKIMLAREHKIRVGEGMIGWAIANNQARVALEIGEDAVRKPTAELPETRSEAALPLISRGRVIGALTVQSTQPGAFDEATIAVLQTMSDLVSAAIDNARLYTETEFALRTARRAYSERTREAWKELLQAHPGLSFRSDYTGTSPVSGARSPEMERAWATGKPVLIPAENSADGIPKFAIPIKVRGSVIGVIQASKSSETPVWTQDEQIMLETIAEQIGLSLDSARLYEETQLRAETERVIGEVSARMRATLDIETVLKTAVSELRSVLDLAEVEIRMGSQPAQQDEE